jgi:hypothetical protein
LNPVHSIIDTFYNDVWKNNKIKYKDGKFSESSKEIDQLILEYINNLKSKVSDVIKAEHNEFLKGTIIRYLCFYVYLNIYIT